MTNKIDDDYKRKIFWPKVALWVCAFFMMTFLVVATAMFLKSAYQYLSLPIIHIPAKGCN